jgi:hypothetical protein
MAPPPSSDASSTASSDPVSSDRASGWVETAARLGYGAKGAVYAVVGVLAVQLAVGGGGETSSSRGALREIAQGPFGQVALTLVTVGLAGYVVWRVVQALFDPEADVSDSDTKRWGKRAFYLLSAVLYGVLTYYGASLLLGSGGGGGGSGSSTGMIATLMEMSWGAWLVGFLGVGVIVRGVLQLMKAYTESFRDKIESFELGMGAQRWILRASRVGLTARGVVFGIIGGSIVHAALTLDPQEARGLDGALDFLIGTPWLLAAVGGGLVGYAVYQWVKARYRLIGV